MKISTTTIQWRAGRLACAAVLFLGLGCLNGCGGKVEGPARFDVSGTVTYASKPVPAGSILFEPDKGNKGPAGYAKIKDGKYDTKNDGAGTVGGSHTVRIVCLDGVAKPDSPDGVLLCPEYTTSVDLPKEKTTKNFEVPQGGGPAGGKPRRGIYDGV